MSVVSFSDRLKMELGNRKASEVRELLMDNCKADEIESLSEEFTSLRSLSLVNVGLNSFSKLPALTELVKIDASENRITGDLEPLTKCPKLEMLNLSSNKIKSLDVLKPLAELSSLKSIDLKDNPVCSSENMCEEISKILPKLQMLDGVPLKDDVLIVGDDDEDDEFIGESEDDEESESEEESYGLQHLQNAEDLEDDENDFNPEDVNEEEDEDFIESDEEDDDDVKITDMSKEEPPAARKRKAGDAAEDEVPSKVATNGNSKNGSEAAE